MLAEFSLLGGGLVVEVVPARRRAAVERVQRVLGVSQRWACRLVGQHRLTQRHQPVEPDRDRALRKEPRRRGRQGRAAASPLPRDLA